MIITLSGRPGSGKSTVSKALAKKLGYKLFSAGDLRGQIAQSHGLTIDQLNKIGEKERWTDEECDSLIARLGKTKDNIIFDSWLAWHFVPKSYKIFLDVDMKEAAQRIFANQRPDEEHQETVKGVLKMITSRLAETRARFKKWYKVDLLDMKNYDSVIDTSGLDVAATVDKVLLAVKGKSLKVRRKPQSHANKEKRLRPS